jgi:DNA modification methylase
MTPYATLGGDPQPTVTLYQGHGTEVLARLPAASVHCVVTSPPYWGLRDYGTGTWEGGAAGCDHRKGPLASPKSSLHGYTGPHIKLATGGMPYAAVCGRCGARRVDQQIGLEPLPFCRDWERGPRCTQCWVCTMVGVLEAVKRVLRDDGTVWLNVGDSYNSSTQFNGHGGMAAAQRYQERTAHAWGGHRPAVPGLKPKDLCGLPWRLALALQAAGWWLRQDMIWSKAAPLPESVQDRCTKSHEYLFLLAKQPRYYFDAEAIKEPAQDWGLRDRSQSKHNTNGFAFAGQPPHRGLTNGNAAEAGRNKRSVWHLGPEPYAAAHFATFPTQLVEPCVLAGSPVQCCAACGAGYRRVVAQSYTPSTRGYIGKKMERNDEAVTPMAGMRRMDKHTTTTGWHPTCACSAGTSRAVVLDIFGGSGTTGLVASQHGRDAILIDLSAAYLALAVQRLTPALAQLPLFY